MKLVAEQDRDRVSVAKINGAATEICSSAINKRKNLASDWLSNDWVSHTRISWYKTHKRLIEYSKATICSVSRSWVDEKTTAWKKQSAYITIRWSRATDSRERERWEEVQQSQSGGNNSCRRRCFFLVSTWLVYHSAFIFIFFFATLQTHTQTRVHDRKPRMYLLVCRRIVLWVRLSCFINLFDSWIRKENNRNTIHLKSASVLEASFLEWIRAPTAAKHIDNISRTALYRTL